VARGRASHAVREFRQWLQAAISCVTAARLTVSTGGFEASPPGADPHTVSLGDLPVLLPGAARIALSVDHHYYITQPAPDRAWKVTTAAYLYALDDEHGRELFAYHWHPDVAGQEQVSYPHLHIGHGAVDVALLDAAQHSRQHNALRAEFHRLHLPTRRIALEDVIRVTIEQFQVEPARADWSRVLQRSRERFQATRSWV
jgi:hypothetical protein